MHPIVGVGELLWDLLPGGRRMAGGAPFNFAFHCQQLGRPAVVVSRVGDDCLGEELRAAVRDLGLSDEFIQLDDTHPTGTVPVTLSADGVPSYTIAENVAWDFIDWTPAVADLLRAAPAVCVGTLAQRGHSRTAVQAALEACGGLKVFDVNLRQLFYDAQTILRTIARCQWLKATYEELVEVYAALDGPKPPGFRFKMPGLAVTNGAARSWAKPGPGWEVSEAPGFAVEVVDTVGAGDAFTAALVCGLLAGRPLPVVLADANAYAAEVCRHPGPTPQFDWQLGDRPG